MVLRKTRKKLTSFEPGGRGFESLRVCHIFNHLGHLTKSRVSEIIRTLKVVIDSSNTVKHQKGEDRNVHIRMDLLAGPDKNSEKLSQPVWQWVNFGKSMEPRMLGFPHSTVLNWVALRTPSHLKMPKRLAKRRMPSTQIPKRKTNGNTCEPWRRMGSA